jgi:hypothetical protein
MIVLYQQMKEKETDYKKNMEKEKEDLTNQIKKMKEGNVFFTILYLFILITDLMIDFWC